MSAFQKGLFSSLERQDAGQPSLGSHLCPLLEHWTHGFGRVPTSLGLSFSAIKWVVGRMKCVNM